MRVHPLVLGAVVILGCARDPLPIAPRDAGRSEVRSDAAAVVRDVVAPAPDKPPDATVDAALAGLDPSRDLAVSHDGSQLDASRDLAVSHDGPGADRSILRPLECGHFVCDLASEYCCLTEAQGAPEEFRCRALGEPCLGTARYCNSPRECGQDQLCCGDQAVTSCIEKTASCSGYIGCQLDADCPAATPVCCLSDEGDPKHGSCGLEKCCGECPRSRRSVKTAIRYLSAEDQAELARAVMGLRLGTYRYRSAPGGARRLGFIIDDLGGAQRLAVAADGEHVDLYGYASMLAAALQVQQRELDAVRRELGELRKLYGRKDAASTR